MISVIEAYEKGGLQSPYHFRRHFILNIIHPFSLFYKPLVHISCIIIVGQKENPTFL